MTTTDHAHGRIRTQLAREAHSRQIQIIGDESRPLPLDLHSCWSTSWLFHNDADGVDDGNGVVGVRDDATSDSVHFDVINDERDAEVGRVAHEVSSPRAGE